MAFLENRYKYSRKNLVSSTIALLRKFSKTITIMVLFVVSALIFTFDNRLGIRSVTLEAAGKISSDCISIIEYMNTLYLSTTNYFKMLEQLRSQNAELQSKLTNLQNVEQQLYMLQLEYNHIKHFANFIDVSSENSITTRLLGVYANIYNRSALISAGNNQGVSVDSVVYTNDGLIGKVINISTNYAKVMLISDPNLRVPVISTASHERAIIAGNGKDHNHVMLLYLDENAVIEPGEIFVTSGDGIHYPYGIPVAKVIFVDQGNHVDVVPCANIYNTGIVRVMLHDNNSE